MEKIKQCLSHAVKLLPYGFMLLIAMFIGYWAKNWIELISGMLLFDMIIICYELKFSKQQKYEESEEK